MTGFIRGLFGGNNNPDQPKEAYFLSEDDAKSFGDIDYMRTSKTVKRTFAKKKGQTEEMESIRSISATGSKTVNEGEMFKPKKAESAATFTSPSTSNFTPSSFTPPKPETPQPQADAAPAPPKAEETTAKRTPDTSMDMFRNMARNIRR
ncbi:MAG: hypothetical protein AAFZ80_10795 [Cyanobacteria bacterium P01_A01_bin.105]